MSGQFEGMIISGGVISFDSNASVRGNKLLVSQLFTEDQKRDTPLFSQFSKAVLPLRHQIFPETLIWILI